MLERKDIEQAQVRIHPYLPHTPIKKCETLSILCQCEVFIKLENLQRTGSFKERGALNKLLSLDLSLLQKGVITASAGNHAQGVAYHAQKLGVPATIVMPEPSPLIKVQATKAYGAQVVLYGENYDEAYQKARELEKQLQLVFIHPFDDLEVIAGQGTIGLEILQDLPEVDAVLIAVGGGGLLAGVGCVLKNTPRPIEIIGVNTEALPSMKRSIELGQITKVPASRTIAEGIAVQKVGDLCYPLSQKYVDRMVTVSDEEIANAILLLMEQEKTVAEGAGAAALAALLHRPLGLQGKKVLAIVCGGNINVNLLARIIDRGLIKDGRRVRLKAVLPDKPGMLAALLTQVGKLAANVVDVRHERTLRSLSLSETEINLVLETRGPEHIEELIQAITTSGYAVEKML